MPDSLRKPPDGRRPRAIRAGGVAALVAGCGLVCGVAFLVERSLSAPTSSPEWRDVTFDVVVSDAATGLTIASAQVGIDEETGQYDPPGPTWEGITDARGQARLVHGFAANTAVGKDGTVRGRVVFNTGSPLSGGSYLLAVQAPGYRVQTVPLESRYPLGIAYEDRSSRPIQVRLSPIPAR